LFVANGLHVPPIVYKLRSLSDLPSLIIQVAGTPTHRVLVSVSAVVYTQIFVSDRISACPYCPFSTYEYNRQVKNRQPTQATNQINLANIIICTN